MAVKGGSENVVPNSKTNNRLLTNVNTNKQFCELSEVFSHVTLKGGLNAGQFRRLAEYSTIKECARKCCASKTCDVAIVMKETCFELQCYSKESCETRPAQLKNFNLMIVYIYREKGTSMKRF